MGNKQGRDGQDQSRNSDEKLRRSKSEAPVRSNRKEFENDDNVEDDILS